MSVPPRSIAYIYGSRRQVDRHRPLQRESGRSNIKKTRGERTDLNNLTKKYRNTNSQPSQYLSTNSETRLGAELAILQKKLGIDHDTVLKDLEEMREISVAFHYESEQLEYLDSLLTAYDETIMKQKKIVTMPSFRSVTFTPL